MLWFLQAANLNVWTSKGNTFQTVICWLLSCFLEISSGEKGEWTCDSDRWEFGLFINPTANINFLWNISLAQKPRLWRWFWKSNLAQLTTAQGQRSLGFVCHVLNLNEDHMETWSSNSTNEPRGQNMNPNSFPGGWTLSLLQRGKANDSMTPRNPWDGACSVIFLSVPHDFIPHLQESTSLHFWLIKFPKGGKVSFP